MKQIKPHSSLLLVLLISACGQQGPLYMPGDEPPVHVPEQEVEDVENIEDVQEIEEQDVEQEQ